MPLSSLALMFMAMLTVALLLEPLARLLHLPFSAALVVGGFAGAHLMVNAGLDTGLRWHHFNDLVFFIFLPVLIFDAALQINARLLLRNLLPVVLLAFPVLLFSAVLCAALLYYGIAHPEGFPWTTALVCGALLAATDPVAVHEIAKRLPVPERLVTLMEGESLLNDATTIVLFTLLLAVAGSGIETAAPATAAAEFARLALGGLAVGVLFGVAAHALIRWLNRPLIVSLLIAYSAYLIAETQLHVSGIMSSLACGLMVSRSMHRTRPHQRAEVDLWWAQLGWIANSSLFLLAGATVTLAMFTERWLAMLIGIGAVLITRLIGVWTVTAISSAIPGQQRIPAGYRVVMTVGSLRGAVTLALALSLPVDLEGWWTAQSIAYGVVIFSLLVQAPALEPLFRRLHDNGRL
jgi:CPA1 family monovalent cation:H+ antiporter